MPGIVGLISGENEKSLFTSMLDSINHYDYKTKSIISQGVHLGNVSHSFFSDRESPYTSEDKKYSVLFDGELFDDQYEHIQASMNIPYYFLKGFLEEGSDFLKKVNGHFQVCIYDHQEKTVYLISDRFSTRPLYYTVHNNRLLFAPEVKALLKDNVDKSIQYEAISDLFHFGHLCGYKTLFTNIHLVPEASYLVFKNNTLHLHRYWDYPYIEEAHIPRKFKRQEMHRYSDELDNLLNKSIDFRLQGDAVSLLIPLSGGLDSRWIVARAHETGKSPITSFTMGGPESEDRKYSHLVAKQLHIEHTDFEITPEPLWEDGEKFSFISDAMSMIYGPIQNFQPYRQYQSNKFTLIAPQMCDAIFGSTLFKKRQKLLIHKISWDEECQNVFTNIFNLADRRYLKLIFQPEFLKRISTGYLETPQHYIEKDKRPIFCYLKFLMNEHGRRGTLGGNLVNNLFFQTRMPSYENDLMEFAFKLPVTLKENQFVYRYTFSRRYPRLARIPRQGTNLPINVSNLRLDLKQMENKITNHLKKTKFNNLIMRVHRWNKPTYIEYANWFKNELREKSESLILGKKILGRGIYDESGLKRILSEHFSGQMDHFRLMWQIINLEYFYRKFID